MRTLLVSTGTPQIPGTPPKIIGPLPNLRAAVATYIPDAGVFVRQTQAPLGLGPGTTLSENVTFKNTGGIAWTGYTISIAPNNAGAFPWGTTSFSFGTPVAPIMPGDEITANFNITAPSQPGSYPLQFVLRTVAGGNLAFSPVQAISVGGPNQFNAQILAFELPETLPYHPGSLLADNRTARVTVKNTGTSDWNAAHVKISQTHVSGVGRNSVTWPRHASQNVPSGSTAYFNLLFGCAGAETCSVKVQMEINGIPFGNSMTQNTECQRFDSQCETVESADSVKVGALTPHLSACFLRVEAIPFRGE